MECSALNILIGTNSSGKSSILQSLLFVGQNFGNAVGLNGRFLSMGTLEESRSVYSSEKNIRAGFEDSKGHMVEMMLFRERYSIFPAIVWGQKKFMKKYGLGGCNRDKWGICHGLSEQKRSGSY